MKRLKQFLCSAQLSLFDVVHEIETNTMNSAQAAELFGMSLKKFNNARSRVAGFPKPVKGGVGCIGCHFYRPDVERFHARYGAEPLEVALREYQRFYISNRRKRGDQAVKSKKQTFFDAILSHGRIVYMPRVADVNTQGKR